MIVKGHDFPKVTLVGILAADLSLNTGDYRAAERTWQLLVQAAGRAGRGDLPGHVVIQTYQPEHYAVRLAARQDLDAFFKEEMRYRAMMQYPPAGHLLAVQIFAKDEEEAAGFARQIGELIERAAAEDGTTRVIGPAPAMIGRINDVYRYGLYLKSRDRERLRELGAMAEAELMIERQRGERKQVMLQFDFDPVRGF
jgi:primosomal protein N' (replication factor Y)